MTRARTPELLIARLGAALWLAAVPGAHAAAPVHHPRARPQTGTASYYGREAAGQKTASGGRFAPRQMTAASRTLPLGTKAKVTNPATGKAVKVTVTDRGPYAKNRIIDVSSKAADQLGMKKKGVAKVKVQPLQTPAQSR